MDNQLHQTENKLASCVAGEDSYFKRLYDHRDVVWKVGIKISKENTAVIFSPEDERSTFLEYNRTRVAHRAILTMWHIKRISAPMQ
jgi:hypothetical protein